MQISGSTILVTGASGGLGTAITEELARQGAHLVITARRADILDDLAARTGAEVTVVDLTDRAAVERLAARAATCDAVVANAGIGSDAAVADTTETDIDRSLDVNLRAPMVLANTFAQAHMRSGKPGQIVMIGSLHGISTSPGTQLYNATKFGLRGFTLALRQSLEGTVVGCTVVEPGFIRDAGMFADGGIELPPGVRTKSPADVAAGVARAITDNPAEVFVAPTELRLAATLGGIAPGFSAWAQRKLGVADRIDR